MTQRFSFFKGHSLFLFADQTYIEMILPIENTFMTYLPAEVDLVKKTVVLWNQIFRYLLRCYVDNKSSSSCLRVHDCDFKIKLPRFDTVKYTVTSIFDPINLLIRRNC